MRGLAALMCLAMAVPAAAVDLPQCDRVTHVSHGGEDMHRDMGDGRVMWRVWWSQEGTATDFVIEDCGPGEALRFRTAEENMGDRLPFDRTDAAMKVIDRHARGARVFATLQRMADDLDGVAQQITLETSGAESCACAALYEGLRGQKSAFALSD